MDEFDTKYGIFLRMMMFNVNKSKLTRKADVREELQIDSQAMTKLIDFSKEKVGLLGFELIGVEKNQIIDPLKADKYYLIKDKNIKIEDCEEVTTGFKKMAAIFTWILVEGGKISMKRLVWLCSKLNIFLNEEIEGFIRFVKKEGYLEIIKEEAEYSVVLGWRFNVEYDGQEILDSLVNIVN